AFARSFLKNVFPLPEVEKGFGLQHASADMILSGLAPLYGRVGRLASPEGYYRLHGNNGYSSLNFDDRLRRDVKTYDHLCAIVARPPKMKPQSMNSNGCAGPAQISLSSLGRRSGGLSTIQASISIFLPNIDVFGRMTGLSFLIYAESQNPH